MEEFMIVMAVLINAVFFGAGMCYVKRVCGDEREMVGKYKAMTDLEIRLLNKRIENINGKSDDS